MSHELHTRKHILLLDDVFMRHTECFSLLFYTDVRLTPIDLPHIQTVLEEASMVWYPLGMKLKLDHKTLTGITAAAGNDISTALTLALARWLD